MARRSVEVAGAERGEFQRRDVSTEFQSKKRREVRDEVHVFPVEKLHRILRPNVSVSPSRVIPQLLLFTPHLRFPFLVFVFVLEIDFRDRSRSKSIVVDCSVLERGGRRVREVRVGE